MPTCFESLIRELETAKLLITIEYAMNSFLVSEKFVKVPRRKETKKENKNFQLIYYRSYTSITIQVKYLKSWPLSVINLSCS